MWRWVVVIAGVTALASTPLVLSALPASHSGISAAALMDRIRASGSVSHSGYAESTGGLGLPVTNQFNAVADLFSGHTQLRVWSLDPHNWRVDAVTDTGENDVHQIDTTIWTWNYEAGTATVTAEPVPTAVRLPTAGDLLPTTLARRLLSEATPDQVTRLGKQRIAGRSTAGLRPRPTDPGTTIDTVDVWADPVTGLALRVDVHGGGTNVMSTQFLDFSTTRPAKSVIAFTPTPATRVRLSTDVGAAASLNRLGTATPPAALAGFDLNPSFPQSGAVGIYGHGVAEFVAAPLPDRTAGSLRRQLDATTGVTSSSIGQEVMVGPLSLVLTPDADRNEAGHQTEWLLVGI